MVYKIKDTNKYKLHYINHIRAQCVCLCVQIMRENACVCVYVTILTENIKQHICEAPTQIRECVAIGDIIMCVA